jgi:hypothetical protein
MITRGTTPTITYTFRTVNPATILESDKGAILSIRQGSVLILKGTDDMHITAATSTAPATAYWELTEDDTLKLRPGLDAEVQLKYQSQGKTYATKKEKEHIDDIIFEGWTIPAEDEGNTLPDISSEGQDNHEGSGSTGTHPLPGDGEITPIGGETE